MMKINRFFLVTLAAAGIFTACSNDEAVHSNKGAEISFRVQGSTPVLRTTSTTLGYVNAFVAYGTDDKIDALAPPDNHIFNGVTVARQQGGGDIFIYSPKKYFGLGAGDAEFAAYSPVSKKVTGASFTYSTDFHFNYEVIIPDVAGKTTQEDLLVAGIKGVPSAMSPVSFLFKHALSRIFVTSLNTTNETAVIKSLTLRNVYSKGTVTIDAASNTLGWSVLNTRIPYPYVLAPTGVAVPANIATKTLVTTMEQGMMILPQDVENNGDNILDANEFALDVVYDYGNLTNQTKTIFLDDTFPFVGGNQYTINIAFTAATLLEITFDITVQPFGDPPVPVNP